MPKNFRALLTLIVLSLMVAKDRAVAAEVQASQSNQIFTLANGTVSVQLDAKNQGAFDVQVTGKPLISGGRLGLLDGTPSLFDIETTLGKGKGIQWARAGLTDRIILYPGLPFVILQQSIRNQYANPTTTSTITQLHLPVAIPSKNVRILGCDGLTSAEPRRASYAFLAAADPATREGIVAGWLTSERGSGIVRSKPLLDDNQLYLEGQVDYGRLLLNPGQATDGEIFAIGHFDDALLGLEAYADAVAKLHRVKLRPIPSGYCTWYSRPHGGAADEKSLAELATFVHDKLARFGFNLIQIDDKWQIANRDYTSHKPKGPYPSGMKPTADNLRKLDLTAGLWFIPFGWDPESPTFDGHQDYFVHRADGSLYEVKWAGTCLDMTNPDARDLLNTTVSRITHDWGYKYLKIDGLWTGMATQILYPNPAVRDDKIGDAVFHDPHATNLQAYRDGLRLVRKAAGDDVFIDGCNVAQNMRTLAGSYGLVDAMLVGRDIGASWDKILPSMTMATRLYFYHGRVWHNDPDCLMLREPLTLAQARAWGSWIAISGQLNLVSEWLPGLPDDRLDIVKRSMPNTGLCGRPMDLFEQPDARIWKLTAGAAENRRDVIGLFNWDAKNSAVIESALEKLDLPGSGKQTYVGFDYWQNEFVAPITGPLKIELPPSSCRVLALRPAADHPQVISTSRHITQGIVDLTEEKWDATTHTLTGSSQVVGEDPYQIRIVAHANTKVTSAQVAPEDKAAGVTINIDDPESNARVTARSPMNRTIHWRITF